MILNNLIIEVIITFGITIIINMLIILWHAHNESELTKRNDTKAIQASHVIPVARIGGLSIIISSVVAATLFFDVHTSWPHYWLILISAFPVFVIGFFEDMGYLVRPRERILAAALSGAVFVILTGYWLPHTDIPVLDLAMQWAPFGIGFSIFLAVGVSHSFNLIDGLNGLSGFTAIGVALSLALISKEAGIYEYFNILLFTCSAIAGFLILNFPLGKIFLGDAGAYFIGHILFWMAISIICVSPNITPFSMLLIFFWPVADTLLAIVRRLYLGVPISNPDRLHFHQLVRRGVEIILLGRKRRHISNPLATVLILPLIFAPMAVGVSLAMNRVESMLACIYFGILFISSYKACMWLARRFRNFS